MTTLRSSIRKSGNTGTIFSILLAAARTLTYTGDDISMQERDSLLSEMETKAEKMSVPIYCGDALVNAVLWQKSNEAKKKNIGFTVTHG